MGLATRSRCLAGGLRLGVFAAPPSEPEYDFIPGRSGPRQNSQFVSKS